MTRNVKRFLAVSLLSLTPSIALAGQNEFGDLDFLSQRSEYVSDRTEVSSFPWCGVRSPWALPSRISTSTT